MTSTSTDKHFKNVYLLKLICILFAAFTIILTFSFSIMNLIDKGKNDFKGITDIKFSNINILNDTNVNIKNLSLSGTNSANAEYLITANEASKNLQGLVKMKDITFTYSKPNLNDKLVIFSDSGTMNELNQEIIIDSLAKLNFSDYSILTNNLLINLKDNSAKSYQAITVKKGESSYLKADSFSTTENSNIINLQGNVKASIDLSNINN
jgi:hypothetical protein